MVDQIQSALNKKAFTWGILFFLVVLFHVEGMLVNNLDDLSVMRASSYISRYPDDRLLTQLREHLDSKSSELSAYVYQRYKLRLTSASNYVAQNWLVGIFEHLPLSSAYQSVFLANLSLHLLAVCSVFWVFGKLFVLDSNVFRICFLLSLTPFLLFYLSTLLYYVHMGWMLLPFHNSEVLWSISAPRGTALTFFFASLVFWLNIGVTSITRNARIVFAILLTIASILSHVSMGGLLIGLTAFFAIFYRLSRLDIHEQAGRLGFRRYFLLLNGLIVVVAITKYLYLLVSGSTEFHILTPGGTQTHKQLARNIIILTSWVLETNLLAYFWISLRQDASIGVNVMLNAGDRFFSYLVPISIVAIGFNVFHPGRNLYYSHLLIPTEASLRIVGLAHILWWMVFGVWLHSKLVHRYKHAMHRGFAAALILLCVTITLQLFLRENIQGAVSEIFSSEKLTIQSSVLLTRPGLQAYADEALYFQAIANELRMKHSEHR